MNKIIYCLIIIFVLFISLYGCQKPSSKEYTITFETNGGNIIDDIILENGKIIVLSEPTKQGYSFDGWFLDNNIFEEKVNLNEPITNDIILYAKWLENPKIVFNLEDGRKIRMELYPKIAPLTVENFLKLIDEDYYNNTVFHRIISNFMIQAGMLQYDGEQLEYKPQRDNIIGEFESNGYVNNLSHTLGVLSMARTTVKNSATAQFFICSATSPHLDGDYAAFGKTLDDESNLVVLSLSNYYTTTFSNMQNFSFTSEGDLVIISSIERISSN